ncbi:uncharacterized protein LTR77_008431 [Saxophila tyrrhenica]|uniref:Uncharacterized protein n=1 Tax=Saxophila tyrrhenica TaxID=1690608 RepID=A0AAV9P3S0_9PEZI|nr:hypothetical protein LTR77_008431 [Saxophila tyrrhenica]
MLDAMSSPPAKRHLPNPAALQPSDGTEVIPNLPKSYDEYQTAIGKATIKPHWKCLRFSGFLYRAIDKSCIQRGSSLGRDQLRAVLNNPQYTHYWVQGDRESSLDKLACPTSRAEVVRVLEEACRQCEGVEKEGLDACIQMHRDIIAAIRAEDEAEAAAEVEAKIKAESKTKVETDVKVEGNVKDEPEIKAEPDAVGFVPGPTIDIISEWPGRGGTLDGDERDKVEAATEGTVKLEPE